MTFIQKRCPIAVKLTKQFRIKQTLTLRYLVRPKIVVYTRVYNMTKVYLQSKGYLLDGFVNLFVSSEHLLSRLEYLDFLGDFSGESDSYLINGRYS